MFIIIGSLLFPFSLIGQGHCRSPDGYEDYDLDYSGKSCTDRESTAIVNIHGHVQPEIIQAIHHLAKQLNEGSVEGKDDVTPMQAVMSYLGTVFDELNSELMKFNVQMNLMLDESDLAGTTQNGSVDPSCEIGDTVADVAANSLVVLKERYDKNVGIHFYVFGCIYNSNKYEPITVLEKDKCGRVAAIRWDGTKNTKNLIKSAILQTLTGNAGIYDKGYIADSDINDVCKHITGCIGSTPGKNGQVIDTIKSITYINDSDTQEELI